MSKYGKEDAFTDPVVRCDSCGKLIKVEELHKTGVCRCGNRKVRAMLTFNWKEKMVMKYWWRVDPDYLKLFSRGEV